MIAEVIVDIAHAEVDKIFDYYFDDCRITFGSRVVVPFGRTFVEGIVIGIKETTDCPPERLKSISRLLEEMPALTPELLELSKYITDTCFVSRASSLRLFLPTEMRKGRVREQFVKLLLLNCDVDSVVEGLNKNAKKQKDLLLRLKEGDRLLVSEMNKTFGTSAVNGLITKGYVKVISEKNFRAPYKDLIGENKKIDLTPKQKLAVQSIKQSENNVSLLFGVTGSGKTEVYLNLIESTINSGKTAIMLVPEISLTPQMLRQLRARFSSSAAILHSGLSAGEKFDEWWRLRTGEAKIAIGARSAVFAPLSDLGLIIIDEEHDGSYKSESSPRYLTHDVALKRAEISGAKVVLGSATPSVETYLKANNGEYNLVELPDRVNKKPLPDIEIVDMRKEIRHGNNSPFSSALKSEIEDCLANGNQAMIFLNQRGYSKTVICTECGHVQKCSSCDVSLTYHKEDESLLCHYCGAKYKMIEACTECGSVYLKHGGYGTERVVYELKKLFPTARILRMDRDTTQNKEGHFKILNEFHNKNADILVGTQMIAKGHDFPSVTLVGILDADMSLHFSDYRSNERTFQLITQVAGRSGRAEESGKVILQTYSPENDILKYAISYDYNAFFKHEISIRKATAFPPYTDILRTLIVGEDEETVVNATKAIFNELSEIRKENASKFRFFGCMKSPIKRLQGKFRYQVLMRINANDLELKNKIFYSVNKYNGKSVSVYLENNPSNLS